MPKHTFQFFESKEAHFFLKHSPQLTSTCIQTLNPCKPLTLLFYYLVYLYCKSLFHLPLMNQVFYVTNLEYVSQGLQQGYVHSVIKK